MSDSKTFFTPFFPGFLDHLADPDFTDAMNRVYDYILMKANPNTGVLKTTRQRIGKGTAKSMRSLSRILPQLEPHYVQIRDCDGKAELEIVVWAYKRGDKRVLNPRGRPDLAGVNVKTGDSTLISQGSDKNGTHANIGGGNHDQMWRTPTPNMADPSANIGGGSTVMSSRSHESLLKTPDPHPPTRQKSCPPGASEKKEPGPRVPPNSQDQSPEKSPEKNQDRTPEEEVPAAARPPLPPIERLLDTSHWPQRAKDLLAETISKYPCFANLFHTGRIPTPDDIRGCPSIIRTTGEQLIAGRAKITENLDNRDQEQDAFALACAQAGIE